MTSPIIYNPTDGTRAVRPIQAADSAFASGAVKSGALGDDVVRSGQIEAGTVGSGHLDSNFVDNISDVVLTSGAIVSGYIASGQIGTGHLADGAVTSGDIGAGQVASGHLDSDFVDNISDLVLTSGAIVSGYIASGQIGTGHLADGAVTSGDIGSGQIGSTHLADGVSVAQARSLLDDVAYVTAEIISGDAGESVHCVAFNSSGHIIIADAISGRMPAIGVMRTNTLSGAAASVFHEGAFTDTGVSGLVGGRRIFVSRSGYLTTTPPSASGDFQQMMGMATAGSGAFLKPDMEAVQIGV